MSNCANCGQYVSNKRTFSTGDNFNRRFCCSACKKEFYASRPIQKFVALVVGAFLIVFIVIFTLNETVPGAKDSINKASNVIENKIIKSIDEIGNSGSKTSEIKENRDNIKNETVVSENRPSPSHQSLDETDSEINSHDIKSESVELPGEKKFSKTYDRGNNEEIDSAQMKIAELKADLAEVETKIQSERDRWKASINVINQLTNFKKTPVREGSPQYHQCMEASRIINEVESGASNLKAQRARLEAMIQSLENR
jgi:chromosome segregation ATPase